MVEKSAAASVRDAVNEVQRQSQAHGRSSPDQRAAALQSFAAAVQKDSDALARIVAEATGRPVARTLHDDVPVCAAGLRHFARLAPVLPHVQGDDDAARGAVVVVPVTADQALATCIDALAPALCRGVAVVLVTDEYAASPARRLLELLEASDAGGASVSVVALDAESVEQAVASGVDAQNGVFTTAEGEARSEAIRPALLFADCDLDQAVEGVVRQALTPSLPGERPGCHLFVEEARARETLKLLSLRLAAVRCGQALEADVELGPLPGERRLRAFEALLATAKDEGVDVQRFESAAKERTRFLTAPALLTGVRPDQAVAQRGLGGPGVCAISFRTPDEALAKLSATGAALGATTIWSEKAGKAPALARRIGSRDIFCNTRDRLTPALSTGSVVALSGGGAAHLLDAAAGDDAEFCARFSVEVSALQPATPYQPLCRCRRILSAVGV